MATVSWTLDGELWSWQQSWTTSSSYHAFGISADVSSRWNDSGAEAAWEAATAKWYPDNPNTVLNLSAHIGNFFHAKPDLSCEYLGNTNCNGPLVCGEQAFPNADVSSPAGYVSSVNGTPNKQLLDCEAVADICI